MHHPFSWLMLLVVTLSLFSFPALATFSVLLEELDHSRVVALCLDG
jgi:hypothetical protein